MSRKPSTEALSEHSFSKKPSYTRVMTAKEIQNYNSQFGEATSKISQKPQPEFAYVDEPQYPTKRLMIEKRLSEERLDMATKTQ